MHWAEIAATVGVTLLGLALGLWMTIGILKKGQADLESLALERHTAIREEVTATNAQLASLRELLQMLSTDGQIQAERYQNMSKALARMERENELRHEELRGEIKRHGREIHELQLWRAKEEGAV
jgi:sensor domain CHASE-containing protein